MEIWKPMPGHEDTHEISSMGNAKSKTRSIPRSNGRPLNLQGKNLTPHHDTRGYLQLSPNCKPEKVHRLVARAFIPNPENKREVNHINGNKEDNRVENLEWATPKENKEHAVKHGLYSIKGLEKSHQKKPVVMCDLDGNEISKFIGVTEAAAFVNGVTTAISKCCKGNKKTYKGYTWRYLE